MNTKKGKYEKSKEKIFEKCVELLKEQDNEIAMVTELLAYLPISASTFYEYYPAQSEKMDILKELINNNKVVSKIGQRKKWKYSENPTLQIAYYKLNATQDELDRLNNNDSKRDVEIAPPPKIVIE